MNGSIGTAQWRGILGATFATLLIAITLGILVLNPIWSRLAVSGLFPQYILPPITAPVDGIYYILNSVLGYQWKTRDPLSLWFHPLLSTLLKLLPASFPKNYEFWFLTLAFAAGTLPLIYQLIRTLSGNDSFSPWLLILCLIAPGGLEFATGNAEIPALFFETALLMSVLIWENSWITLTCAILAILTKPNALYMVPLLAVYLIVGLHERNNKLISQSLLGIVFILGTWLAWIWVVDWKTGGTDIYWAAREQESIYLGIGGNIFYFFGSLAQSFLTPNSPRDEIRYGMALAIPLANYLFIGLAPTPKNEHRFAAAAGNTAMLAIELLMGNPNKILVYTTTLPTYFPVHLILIGDIFNNFSHSKCLKSIVIGIAYLAYCFLMVIIYVLGTPLRWYH